jgi:hypothetical protein
VNPRPLYLDSSAVVKLVFEEAETPALEAFLIDGRSASRARWSASKS